jgi:hypothetical protein
MDCQPPVLMLVMAFRSSGIGPLPIEGPRPDLAMLELLDAGASVRTGRDAEGGGDIRERLA